MAITDNTRIIGAINKQGNSTDPGCGCGAVIVQNDEDLPRGDYVAFQCTDGAAAISLTTILFSGAPITNVSGNAITTFASDPKAGTTLWYANIESCKNAGDNPIIFYKRCK